MRPEPVVALDLGSTKVACVVAQRHPALQGLTVLGTSVVNYPVPTRTWPCEPAMVAPAIEQALEETRLTQRPDRVVVTLSHPQASHSRVTAQLRLADEPVTIRTRELERLRDQAIAQTLGIDQDLLCLEPLGYRGNGFDGVRNPRGLVATRLSGVFQLVAIPLAVRRMVTETMDRVGVDVVHMGYSLQAVAITCAAHAIVSPFPAAASPDPASRSVVIDLGGWGTDLAIVEGGRLVRSATIPWGGMSVVEAIAQECRLPVPQALSISLEGLASARPTVRKIVERHLHVLGEHLHQFLTDERIPERIIITGRSALMDGVVEWVEQMSHINAMLGRSPQLQHQGDVSRQVACTAAMGALELAVRGAEKPARPFATPRVLDRLFDRTKALLVDYF